MSNEPKVFLKAQRIKNIFVRIKLLTESNKNRIGKKTCPENRTPLSFIIFKNACIGIKITLKNSYIKVVYFVIQNIHISLESLKKL